MGRPSLEAWLIEAMTDEDKSGPIAAISLWHCDQLGEAQREVHAVRFGPKVWQESELADLFKHKAETQCIDETIPNLFVLQAYYGNDKEAAAFYPFRARASSDGKFKLMSEAPNETGMRQQAMRGLELMMQGVFKERAVLMDQTLRTLEVMGRHNRQLAEESRRKDEVIFEMGFRQSTHMHEQKMKELAATQKAELIAKVTEIAPAFIQQLTGRKVLPDASVDTSLMKTLAAHLDENNTPVLVQALATVLPEHALGLLASRLGEIVQEKEKRKKDGQTILSVVSAEEDLEGGKKDEAANE